MTEIITERQASDIEGALAAIMLEAKAVGKDSRNQSQGFNFRGIDAIMNHLHPIFAKHGVIILPEVLAERTEERTTKSGGNLIYRVLKVCFHFTAADGSSVHSTVIGEGMDSGDKASNKAMAVALKYALTQMLLLPYDEVDADATTPEPSKPRNFVPTEPKPSQAAAMAATRKPAPAERTYEPDPNAMQTATVVLGDVKRQHGEGRKGPWTRTYTKADNGQFYSTFDTKLGQKLEELAGATAILGYVVKTTPKGTSNDVMDVRPVAPRDTAEPTEAEQKALDAADDQRKGKKEDNLPF